MGPDEERTVAEYTGSRVPRRQLGRALRELRTEAGLTLDGAAEALECSRQKVWRIESGLRAVRGLAVRAMRLLYGASAELTTTLCALAVETRAKGWWHAYDEFSSAWFDPHGGLESSARSIREHADALVPELLQVPGYALGLHEHDPGGGATSPRPGAAGPHRVSGAVPASGRWCSTAARRPARRRSPG
ncbi:helix-turn-helix domain-containing protein [Micromonospora inyonensis]|uniref:Helix-turn-helix domain-containing protein n=1 Tax=Micromonospora inyonensis TaxID=47866 RepID=A0A1C6SAH7_9ACTN|nr:helix-turn-helix transcriptional regulator [Micromonospora inyonensis]SCL26394.1 Helix-turn-helix domain-containing protein [Micromonospora inyonensis]